MSTEFGAKITTGTALEQKEVLDKLGVKLIRMQETLRFFDLRIGFIDSLFPQGVKFELNVSWEPRRLDNQPVDFCTDLVAYERQLRKVCDKYAPKDGIMRIEHMVCENEPTTDSFYKNGQIQQYLKVLRVFARVCKEYGIPCSDGCVHLENIWLIIIGAKIGPDIKRTHNVPDIIEIMKAIKEMPDLTYANFHFGIKSPDEFPPDRIKQCADYLRNATGKEVVNNEWHCTVDDSDLMRYTVGELKKANPNYSIVWGGGGQSEAPGINKGTNLTPLGIAYRDAIKQTA